MMHTHVPATADPQIGTFRNQMNHTSVCGIFSDRFGSSVCRMVIHNNQIKAEGRFLCQHGTDSIFYRTDTVADRDDNGGFLLETASIEGDRFKVRGKITADPFQVGRTNSFHLDLHRPVFRINIIEQLLSALADIRLHFRVQIFIDMNQFGQLRDTKAKVIQPGKTVISIHRPDRLLQNGRTEKQQGAEIKIITQASFLIVYDRSLLAVAVF